MLNVEVVVYANTDDKEVNALNVVVQVYVNINEKEVNALNVMVGVYANINDGDVFVKYVISIYVLSTYNDNK